MCLKYLAYLSPHAVSFALHSTASSPHSDIPTTTTFPFKTGQRPRITGPASVFSRLLIGPGVSSCASHQRNEFHIQVAMVHCYWWFGSFVNLWHFVDLNSADSITSKRRPLGARGVQKMPCADLVVIGHTSCTMRGVQICHDSSACAHLNPSSYPR